MQFSGSCHLHQTSAKTISGYEELLQLCLDVSSKSYAKATTSESHWLQSQQSPGMNGFWNRAIKADRKENQQETYKSYLSWRGFCLLLLEMCILL